MFHKMAKAFILLIGICAYAVQGSVLRNEDAVLKRHARSPCDECESSGIPAPPPPPPGIPPVFHTEQWSGLTHSNGGQGVFSGAAASIDGGTQTGSQAFSLASASGGDGEKKGTVAPELLSNRFGFDKDSDSFGQSSGGDFGGQGGGFGGGKKFSGSKSNFKESHFTIQSGDLQFGKGFGFKDGDIFHHQQFYKPGHGFGGFEGARNIHGGFGARSSSQSSSFYSRDEDGAGAIQFEGQNSEIGDLNNQFGHSHSGSGFGGSSSSASSASSAFSGNQQLQQLQSGFGGGVQGSGSGSTGRLEFGSSGYGNQNAQFSHSGSDYQSFGKSDGFSSSEQQQQQNLQQGSQRGFESDGTSGLQQSGFGSGGHFESGSSAFGSQNSHFGQSGSGYGQGNGFNANEQQQQQQQNHQFGQLQSGSGFGAGSASSASSSSSGNQQQLHLGSQTGFESNGGSQSQGAGFGVSGKLTGGSTGHYGQQESSFNSFGKGDGFDDNGQQQQLQLGSNRGFESNAGSQSQGAGFGSAGLQTGGGHYAQHGSNFDSFGKSEGFTDNGQQQQQQLQLGSQSGFETAGSQEGLASGSSSSSSSQASGSSGSYGANQQGQSDLHTGIGGALQLAAQGLKQAQEQNSGCSTCGKSSYALSNAKSHSGSAIALSVAG